MRKVALKTIKNLLLIFYIPNQCAIKFLNLIFFAINDNMCSSCAV